MDRWTGRVALVTGASAGIGAAIAKELVLKGMKVIGVARRVERIEALQKELESYPGKLYPLACDVTKEVEVLEVFQWATENLGGVDVLVNNAGIYRPASLHDGKTWEWQNLFEVNVIALSTVTREALKSMRSRGVDDGHIIHINSIAGHRVGNFPDVSMYCATKHGVTALAQGLRNELLARKSRIKVTSLSPGMVRTEILAAAKVAAEVAERRFEGPCLEAKDIADAVLFVLGTPPHVQIEELIIRPVGEGA